MLVEEEEEEEEEAPAISASGKILWERGRGADSLIFGGSSHNSGYDKCSRERRLEENLFLRSEFRAFRNFC